MARYQIRLKPSAVRDLDRLRKHDATIVAEALERHLSNQPTRTSKSRIKRLRGLEDPDYRLRVGDYRVFYTVDLAGSRVHVLRIMHKSETDRYYEELRG